MEDRAAVNVCPKHGETGNEPCGICFRPPSARKFSELRDKMPPESRARAEAKAKEMLKAMEDKRVEEAREWRTQNYIAWGNHFKSKDDLQTLDVDELLAAYREPLEGELVSFKEYQGELEQRISELEESLRKVKKCADGSEEFFKCRHCYDLAERALKGERK